MAYNIPDYFLPVYSVNKDNGSFRIKEIHGTASYIGKNKFITAGHSIKYARNNGLIAIGHLDSDNNIVLLYSQKEEIKEEFDIGIIQISSEIPKNIVSYSFSSDKLLLNMDVWTCGYPHALDRELNVINFRGLKGYIVCGRYFKFNKGISSTPFVHEISFHCPSGISGAPLLLSQCGKEDKIIGYIIGNSNIEMTISIMKEVEKESGIERIYEKTETSTFGIAVSIENFLDVRFEILGGNTFKEYLKENKLI